MYNVIETHKFQFKIVEFTHSHIFEIHFNILFNLVQNFRQIIIIKIKSKLKGNFKVQVKVYDLNIEVQCY